MADRRKTRLFLEGLCGKDNIAEWCRREQIKQNPYYRWSKELLETDKKRLANDTKRPATSDEVKASRAQAVQLKELLVEMLLENRLPWNNPENARLLRSSGPRRARGRVRSVWPVVADWRWSCRGARLPTR